jgi:hypothetical protein
MRIHFKTLDYQDRKTVRFDAFKMNCDQVSKVFDMNQKAEGDVSLLFQNFSSSLNENVVERSFKESSSQFTVSKEGIKSVWEYGLGISCEIKN